MDALRKAIQIVGGQAVLARKLGLAQQVVHNWLRRESVPADYCPAIEKATSGRVRCEDLRPAVDWGFIRATECEKASPATTAEQEIAAA